MKNSVETLNLTKLYLNHFPCRRIAVLICPPLAVLSVAVCFYLLKYRNYDIESIPQIIILMHSPLPGGDLLLLLNWAFPQILLAYICGLFLDGELNEDYVLTRINNRRNGIYAKGLSLSVFCFIYVAYLLAVNLAASLILAEGVSYDGTVLSIMYIGAGLFCSSLSLCFLQMFLSYACGKTKLAFAFIAVLILLNGFVRFPKFLYFLGTTTILSHYAIYDPMRSEVSLPSALLINIFFIAVCTRASIVNYEKKDILSKETEDK